MNLETRYQSTDCQIWLPRPDEPLMSRFSHKVSCWSLFQVHSPTPNEPAYGILGFACDEGIRRNRGRPGANQGPSVWRRAFAKQAMHLKDPACHYYDFGDILCEDGDLEKSQEALAEAVAIIVKEGIQPVVIGGGHEVAWGHYQGLTRALPAVKIGVINFDAHFDLRPLDEKGKGNSGSSFHQMAEWSRERGQEFRCLTLGVQEFSNTSFLYEEAKRYGVKYLSAQDWQQGGDAKALALIDEMIASCDALYVTVCLDVLAAPYAPGVSAPQPLGMTPQPLLRALQHVSASGKALAFDVAELSPPNDINNITANLAGIIVANYLSSHTLFPLECAR